MFYLDSAYCTELCCLQTALHASRVITVKVSKTVYSIQSGAIDIHIQIDFVLIDFFYSVRFFSLI